MLYLCEYKIHSAVYMQLIKACDPAQHKLCVKWKYASPFDPGVTWSSFLGPIRNIIHLRATSTFHLYHHLCYLTLPTIMWFNLDSCNWCLQLYKRLMYNNYSNYRYIFQFALYINKNRYLQMLCACHII